MALYEYRCGTDGVFEVSRPIGTAPPTLACPVCAADAARVISAPMVLSSSRSVWSAAVERADKTRYEPEVVTSLPSAGNPRGARVVPLTPRLATLPRPDFLPRPRAAKPKAALPAQGPSGSTR